MNIPTSQATRHRLESFAQTNLFRYLLAGLGTASIGMGTSVLVRRPHRLLIGGGMIVAGAAMLVRGVRGAWPRLVVGEATRPYMPAVSTDADADAGVDESWGENQGEGNKTAARNYNRQVRQFMNEGKVEPAARSAARAVDGPEGASLRAAEEKAKQSPSNGRH